MKTLTNLSAANCADDGKPSPESKPFVVKGKIVTPKFMRQRRRIAGGEIFESNSGASVFIPDVELFKMVEAHESKFCQPQTVDNKNP